MGKSTEQKSVCLLQLITVNYDWDYHAIWYKTSFRLWKFIRKDTGRKKNTFARRNQPPGDEINLIQANFSSVCHGCLHKPVLPLSKVWLQTPAREPLGYAGHFPSPHKYVYLLDVRFVI